MTDFLVRAASPAEYEAIYKMGYDVWSEGKSLVDYLKECRESPKYKIGDWHVLAKEQKLLSSLIVYNLGERLYGIGSIATPLILRKQGFASRLIREVVAAIEKNDIDAVLFLYADIAPEFYERLGFAVLPKEAQRYTSTKCMIRGNNTERFVTDVRVNPEYF